MTNITAWRDETIALLRNRPASVELEEIAKHVKVTKAWLQMLLRGEIEHPSVVRIQTLNVYLKKANKKA